MPSTPTRLTSAMTRSRSISPRESSACTWPTWPPQCGRVTRWTRPLGCGCRPALNLPRISLQPHVRLPSNLPAARGKTPRDLRNPLRTTLAQSSYSGVMPLHMLPPKLLHRVCLSDQQPNECVSALLKLDAFGKVQPPAGVLLKLPASRMRLPHLPCISEEYPATPVRNSRTFPLHRHCISARCASAASSAPSCPPCAPSLSRRPAELVEASDLSGPKNKTAPSHTGTACALQRAATAA